MSLNSFLTDIANAIRSKKGTNDKINAKNFANEIENLPSGGADEEEIYNELLKTNFGDDSIVDDKTSYEQGYEAGYEEGKAEGGSSIDGIPQGYARCDYIQFSGKQIVDTGIIGNQDTQINAIFTWESSTQAHLYGCAHAGNTASITSYMNGSWRFGNKSTSKTVSLKNGMLPYSSLVDKTQIALCSGRTAISGVNDFETIGTLLLGNARNSNGGIPSTSIVGKVFYFSIYQGDKQVLKLVPVVSATDEYSFFDLISKTFFNSITSEALTGGYL